MLQEHCVFLHKKVYLTCSIFCMVFWVCKPLLYKFACTSHATDLIKKRFLITIMLLQIIIGVSKVLSANKIKIRFLLFVSIFYWWIDFDLFFFLPVIGGCRLLLSNYIYVLLTWFVCFKSWTTAFVWSIVNCLK